MFIIISGRTEPFPIFSLCALSLATSACDTRWVQGVPFTNVYFLLSQDGYVTTWPVKCGDEITYQFSYLHH